MSYRPRNLSIINETQENDEEGDEDENWGDSDSSGSYIDACTNISDSELETNFEKSNIKTNTDNKKTTTIKNNDSNNNNKLKKRKSKITFYGAQTDNKEGQKKNLHNMNAAKKGITLKPFLRTLTKVEYADLYGPPPEITIDDLPITLTWHTSRNQLEESILTQEFMKKRCEQLTPSIDNTLQNNTIETLERRKAQKAKDNHSSINLPITVKKHTAYSKLLNIAKDHKGHQKRMKDMKPNLDNALSRDIKDYRRMRSQRRNKFSKKTKRDKQKREKSKQQRRTQRQCLSAINDEDDESSGFLTYGLNTSARFRAESYLGPMKTIMGRTKQR